MGVGVDQPRYDPAAGDVHLAGFPRQLEAVAVSDRLDSASANDYGRVFQCRTAATVEECRAHEGDTIGGRGPAAAEQQSGGCQAPR